MKQGTLITFGHIMTPGLQICVLGIKIKLNIKLRQHLINHSCSTYLQNGFVILLDSLDQSRGKFLRIIKVVKDYGAIVTGYAAGRI